MRSRSNLLYPDFIHDDTMATRALQAVTITFGLVTIPVRMHPATDPAGRIHFHFLHKCGSRVSQQYRCVEENKNVPRSELVKAYEFEKDRFVTFTPQELDALEEASSGAIEIAEFVAQESVDPVYYERAYYLAPDKGGAKPYALLAEAMRRSGRTAIGRWAARGRQHLVQVRVAKHGLVLQQLLYDEEVREFDEVKIAPAKVTDGELKLAAQLIDTITSRGGFDPARYDDDVKERIEELIQRKVAGHDITAPEGPKAPQGARVIDLMEALRASLNSRSGAAAEARRPPRKSDRAESRTSRTTASVGNARKSTTRKALRKAA